MQVNWLFISVICNLVRNVLLDFHSSVYTLTLLAREEIRLVYGLQRYVQTLEKNDEPVDESVLRFVEELKQDVKEDNEVLIDNPIDAFHLLKRWVQDWDKCLETVLCPDCMQNDEAVDFSITKGIVENRLKGWPNEVELKAVVSSMFRLWDVYEFDLNDFIKGKIFKFQTKPLSPKDVIYIANHAEDVGNFYAAVRFLETLLEEVQKGEIDSGDIKESKLARIVAAAYNRNDMPWKSVEILNKYTAKDPDNRNLKEDLKYFKTRADSVQESEHKDLEKPNTNINVVLTGGAFYEEEMIKKYKQLCRGQLKTATEQSRLFCYYKQTKDIFYRVKTELANKQPRVFIFHDIITEEEMNFIQNKSVDKLIRSTILLDSHSNSGEAELRVSKTAWLSDLDHPLLRNLTRRVELITGLQTTYKVRRSNTEPYQVLNYGVGGMYRPHTDPLNVNYVQAKQSIDAAETLLSGDRVATFLFYLSDVMYGGATVFPKLKARVPVRKGSAAFWYNLNLNGDSNGDMWHAGCPVLVGSKWVSNKWIREIGQIFIRPCGLKKYSKDKQF